MSAAERWGRWGRNICGDVKLAQLCLCIRFDLHLHHQTRSFGSFICAFLFRVNLFNLFIWSASNCVMKFWSRANIFILLQYYFTTAFFGSESRGFRVQKSSGPSGLRTFFCNRLFIKIIYNCVLWFRVPRVPSVKILGTLGTRNLFF